MSAPATELWSMSATQGDGLPQAVQVIGPRYREDPCLDAAAAIEERCGPLTPIDPTWWSP